MPSWGLWGTRFGLCAVLFGGSLGCLNPSGPQQATTFSGAKRPELSCAREGAERVDVGSWRGTGRPDVARVYKREGGFRSPSVLSCREVDLNGDGRKDVLVYFEADGKKLREEFDHDYDGVADIKAYYEQGKLVRQEVDVNHDGKADVVHYYDNGKVVRSERIQSEPEGEKPATDKTPVADKSPEKASDKPAAPSATPSTTPSATPSTTVDPPNLPR